jgi:hypothetical protein
MCRSGVDPKADMRMVASVTNSRLDFTGCTTWTIIDFEALLSCLLVQTHQRRIWQRIFENMAKQAGVRP